MTAACDACGRLFPEDELGGGGGEIGGCEDAQVCDGCRIRPPSRKRHGPKPGPEVVER